MILRGPQSLSDAELIAILLRTGTRNKSVISIAQDIIIKYNSLIQLSTKPINEIIKTKGIGKNKAATLLAAFELSKRIAVQTKWFSDKKITAPQDVADIFIPILKDELIEKFIVICLNTSNKIIRYEIISIGSLDSSLVHPREVFKVAIENSAKSLILLHNHPSGNKEPSNEDINLTKKLIEAGKIFEIPIFDHLIIAGNEFTSFVEKRLM